MLPELLSLLLMSEARAYPWMIAHQYTGCAQCHVDPSGAGTLTSYGRAQSEVLLRTHYGPSDPSQPEETGAFLFGAVPLPEWLALQADVRPLLIPDPQNVRLILMQADARGAVSLGRFVASGSVGVVSEGAQAARLLQSGNNVQPVSREHWLGVRPMESLLVRAGRMPLPFGVRTEQHLQFDRAVTRTTLNDDQSLGVSASLDGQVRGEIMLVLGNYAVSPDSFRERGYAGSLSYAPDNRLELGISSLLLGSGTDLETLGARTRAAEGLFARWGPLDELAVLVEADLLLDQREEEGWQPGFVGTLQTDAALLQGLHWKASGELCALPEAEQALGRAGTALQWFAAPHVDVRADFLYGPVTCSAGAEPHPLAALQLHVFL
jgi:hypothetical protein